MGLLETVKTYWLAGMTALETADNIRRVTGNYIPSYRIRDLFTYFNRSFQNYKVELPRG